MAESPDKVPRAAVLASITTEASGFYGLIVTVASSFLGGSLLFVEKIAPAGTGWFLWVLALAWLALIGSIGCIARLRYMNLKSGRLALRGDFGKADKIDCWTDRLSNCAQWLLIGGMIALMVVGLANVNSLKREERRGMENTKAVSLPATEKTSIPYGSVGPTTSPSPRQPAQQPSQDQPQQGPFQAPKK